MLIDDVTVRLKAGDGGNGAATFLRNARTSKGGPDGGNGGNGGDLYLIGVNDITALKQFRFKKFLKAEDGVNGAKHNLYGRNGTDLYVKVPVGTSASATDGSFSVEITDEATPVLILKGGKGGRGNNEFKSATNQAPRYAEKGEEGQEKSVKLVLSLIADIGLIGLPNAGKSSLLTALTNASPKIGDYPFTTLEPNLGVMKGVILADIPGLIEGASSGRGLGIKFLKHIEKTQLLVHCIDISQDNLKEIYTVVRNEFATYNKELLEKKELILLTKDDLVTEEEKEKKMRIMKKITSFVFSVSVLSDESVDNLSHLLQDHHSSK